MKVSVIGGGGYVGLVTAAGLAELGHEVISMDKDPQRIAQLKQGKAPFHESGLEPLIASNLKAGRIRFTSSAVDALAEASVLIIAVGTPTGTNGSTDLTEMEQVIRTLAPLVHDGQVIVIKSTVPVGTADLFRETLNKAGVEDSKYELVSNPEFLSEGRALKDFFHPSRIIIGAHTERARQKMRELYRTLLDGGEIWDYEDGRSVSLTPTPILETGIESAQIIKYASNAFLATRLSFINEIAALSERVGADIDEVIDGIGYDDRIGRSYLRPGIGFGGPCLEKDLMSLLSMAERVDFNASALAGVLERNVRQAEEFVDKIAAILGGDASGKRIGVLGLSFKAGTDDVRNSVAVKIIDKLLSLNASVISHDPISIPAAKQIRPGYEYALAPSDVGVDADVLVVLTDWPEFNDLDYAELGRMMKSPRMVDGRNMLNKQQMKDLGFEYVGVGIA
ncbi:MAG: UDP-glucose/GDP-mannose dehydrogenase family protein [Chloroflexi bacterium]|nr:UDP-glucose/GDP-mannose dehydrogenase family protein [Chloroflexota bacterium]